jgi:hypothetical protein
MEGNGPDRKKNGFAFLPIRAKPPSDMTLTPFRERHSLPCFRRLFPLRPYYFLPERRSLGRIR